MEKEKRPVTKAQIAIKVNYLVFNKLLMILFGFIVGVIVGGVVVYYAADLDSDDYIRGYSDALELELK